MSTEHSNYIGRCFRGSYDDEYDGTPRDCFILITETSEHGAQCIVLEPDGIFIRNLMLFDTKPSIFRKKTTGTTMLEERFKEIPKDIFLKNMENLYKVFNDISKNL